MGRRWVGASFVSGGSKEGICGLTEMGIVATMELCHAEPTLTYRLLWRDIFFEAAKGQALSKETSEAQRTEGVDLPIGG